MNAIACFRLENNRYELDHTKLAADRCHVFCLAQQNSCPMMAITVLESRCFPSDDPDKELLFSLSVVGLQTKDSLVWCSFPVGYRETCEKIVRECQAQLSVVARIHTEGRSVVWEAADSQAQNDRTVVWLEGPVLLASEYQAELMRLGC
ncbi:MAG: hypothetical protein RL235_785 [Chlamydiota bacterium]|jgi:hypothetical protein